MATNVFFQNYNYFNEQQLIDDLVIESIQIFGVDTYYVSRIASNVDEIMNEDDTTVFSQAFQMEMYIKSVDGFEGDGDFLSKFGLQIRDAITFTVAIRTFEKHTTRYRADLIRPREGDLVYMPMNRKFFKVTFVEHESVFYQSGALQVYDLKCELFEYSNEIFETGLELVDSHYAKYRTDNINSIGRLFSKDPIAKNIVYEESKNDVVDFGEIDPFTETIGNPSNYARTADMTTIRADNTTIRASAV